MVISKEEFKILANKLEVFFQSDSHYKASILSGHPANRFDKIYESLVKDSLNVGDTVMYDNFGNSFSEWSEIYKILTKDELGIFIGNDDTKPFFVYPTTNSKK